MARRKAHVSALDNLREALQSLPVKRAVSASDKRSSGRTRRLTGELSEYKPSKVAAELGVSTQKYVAIRRQAEAGKVSSPVLNDLLEQTAETLGKKTDLKRAAAALPHAKEGEYISEMPVNGKRKFKVDYEIASQGFMKKKMPWAVNVKPGGFSSLQSATNWYGNVTGGKEYFWIVKGKKGRYYIYDVRTAAERGRKGKVSGGARAEGIMETYEDWHDMYDEFEDEIFDEFGDDFGEEFEDDFEDEIDEPKPRRKNNAKSKGSKSKKPRGRSGKGKGKSKGGRAKTGRSVAAGRGKNTARGRKAR